MNNSHSYNAFEISPVPTPSLDAKPPELYKGIYGMPMFVTIPTSHWEKSLEFWCEILGFFVLYSVEGQFIHLRRWAFQDVLLVAGETTEQSAHTVSFACVLTEIKTVSEKLGRAGFPLVGPTDTAWNSRQIQITSPENCQVVLTAAKPFDQEGLAQVAHLGITPEDEDR